jgi:hypothetical protein
LAHAGALHAPRGLARCEDAWFGGLALADTYTSRPDSYIKRPNRAARRRQFAEERAMRAEAEKLVEVIRQSLALLRRHL